MLKGKTVLLGVTGSIAAYKIAYLASALKKLHAQVHVLMTQNATNFINPITFETLTGNKCLVDTFDRNFQFSVEHVSIAKQADVVMIAPASANVIGKLAHGIADGKEKTYYIYNVCDHQECYHEVGSQAISYTTGVPAMCGALMMLTGKWIRPGVYTVEEFDPDPFLDALDRYGLPRSESHDPKLVD